jgi:hypothetical protein
MFRCCAFYLQSLAFYLGLRKLLFYVPRVVGFIITFHRLLTERRAFFAWSASDIRKMFRLLWDHLALTTPIAIGIVRDMSTTEGVLFERDQELIDRISGIIGLGRETFEVIE